MQDRVADLESRLAFVEKRLAALECASSAAIPARQAVAEPSLGETFVADASSHIGRVLLIFGGAYLLRAITDFQFVPTGVGLLMGASYALFWLYMAWRRGAGDRQRTRAMFFGGTSVLLGLPLLVEAVSRFQLLSGPQGILALGVYCALALTVAVACNLRTLGWLVTAGGMATAFAVMIVSHTALAAASFLMALGFGTLWIAYRRGWPGLEWLGAFGANAGVVAVVALSTSEQWTIQPHSGALYGAFLLLAYLASFAFRSHVRGHALGLFEIAEALVAATIAWWAASVAADAAGESLATAGLLSIAIGVFAYALAFTRMTRTARGRNFFFYSTFGLLFVLAGTAIVLPLANAAALWSLMAIAAAWASGRTGRVALSLQCTLLLVAAGAGSGVLSTGLFALAADTPLAWPQVDPWQIWVAAATVTCLFLPVAQHSKRWGTAAGLPQLIALALSVWEVGGLAVVVVAPPLAGAGTDDQSLAILAALRTAVLAAASVSLAMSSRFRRWPEARWLVYPVLILVAIKLFAEDFPHGQPASLFVALAFVGSALLLVAKLLQTGGGADLRADSSSSN